ncbi:MAG: hypothetical protein ACOYXT_01220 [Bacteroidota bacterium]
MTFEKVALLGQAEYKRKEAERLSKMTEQGIQAENEKYRPLRFGFYGNMGEPKTEFRQKIT